MDDYSLPPLQQMPNQLDRGSDLMPDNFPQPYMPGPNPSQPSRYLGVPLPDPVMMIRNQQQMALMNQATDNLLNDATRKPTRWERGQNIGDELFTNLVGPLVGVAGGPAFGAGVMQQVGNIKNEMKSRKQEQQQRVDQSIQGLKNLNDLFENTNKQALDRFTTQINATRYTQEETRQQQELKQKEAQLAEEKRVHDSQIKANEAHASLYSAMGSPEYWKAKAAERDAEIRQQKANAQTDNVKSLTKAREGNLQIKGGTLVERTRHDKAGEGIQTQLGEDKNTRQATGIAAKASNTAAIIAGQNQRAADTNKTRKDIAETKKPQGLMQMFQQSQGQEAAQTPQQAAPPQQRKFLPHLTDQQLLEIYKQRKTAGGF